jgi:hypothetical protein
VTLPREYLDERPRWWLRGNPERRTLDLAYATTGHKAQGITRDEVLVRVTSSEDRQWLHVAGSRGIGKTTFYSVVTPSPPAATATPSATPWTCPPPTAPPRTRPTSSPRWRGGTAASGSPPTPPPPWTRGA